MAKDEMIGLVVGGSGKMHLKKCKDMKLKL